MNRRTSPSYLNPVDLVSLARHTSGNETLERERLRLFVSQSQEFLTRLRKYIKRGDDKEWRATVSTIRVLAESVKARPLTDMVAVIERKERVCQIDLDVIGECISEADEYIAILLSDGESK